MVRFLAVTPLVSIPAGEGSSLHQHDFWQLDRIRKGSTLLETREGRRAIPMDTLVLVAPHVSHTYRFHREVTIDTVKFQSPVKLPLPMGFLTLTASGERDDLLSRFLGEWEKGGRNRLTICSHYLELFLLRTAEEVLQKGDPGMESARDLLLECQDASAVARHFSLTPGHLAERFKNAYGHTPTDWLRRHRIEDAKRRLHFTEEPIDDIAQAAGYANVYAFSKAFKRITLTSPARFRKMREG